MDQLTINWQTFVQVGLQLKFAFRIQPSQPRSYISSCTETACVYANVEIIHYSRAISDVAIQDGFDSLSHRGSALIQAICSRRHSHKVRVLNNYYQQRSKSVCIIITRKLTQCTYLCSLLFYFLRRCYVISMLNSASSLPVSAGN